MQVTCCNLSADEPHSCYNCMSVCSCVDTVPHPGRTEAPVISFILPVVWSWLRYNLKSAPVMIRLWIKCVFSCVSVAGHWHTLSLFVSGIESTSDCIILDVYLCKYALSHWLLLKFAFNWPCDLSCDCLVMYISCWFPSFWWRAVWRGELLSSAERCVRNLHVFTGPLAAASLPAAGTAPDQVIFSPSVKHGCWSSTLFLQEDRSGERWSEEEVIWAAPGSEPDSSWWRAGGGDQRTWGWKGRSLTA